MGIEQVAEIGNDSEGRDAVGASRLKQDGEVVVKWLGAVVEEAASEDASGSVGGDSVVGTSGSGERDGDAGAPRRLLMRAALGTEDRKGDVIDANGWELEGYRRNPVFLWAHDRGRPPIGVAREIWVAGGSLNALVEFAPTEFAREVAELYTRGFMRAVSVGFLPLETEMRRASNGRRGYLYRRQELLEISAVPVPMHSEALAEVREGASPCVRFAHASPFVERKETKVEEDEDILQLRAGVRRLLTAAGLLVD